MKPKAGKKTLLDAGMLHGGCLTVTGHTVAENLAAVKPYPAGQAIVRPLSDPIKADSHLAILYGNLAPEGAVAKITGKEGTRFEGRARVFNSEHDALRSIIDGGVLAGHEARYGDDSPATVVGGGRRVRTRLGLPARR